jgi:predicted enzyme related to lactoylglutathione lyase
MLNFKTVLLFSENPKKLSDFYKKVFEKEPDWEDGGYSAFGVGNCSIMVGPHDKVKGKSQNPERFMFNLETDNVNEEFKRIEKLGAKVIAKPYSPMEGSDALIATFADPDGNFFQLATPWDDGKN